MFARLRVVPFVLTLTACQTDPEVDMVEMQSACGTGDLAACIFVHDYEIHVLEGILSAPSSF
ncbi:hypothetical protein Q0601_15030 [Paracoccus onubensis]|uniref:hypothetical protein n=1 Tax=Paracoccus onubensis TaxID=1675788 RepID=UPI0027310A92|nr:hypothetical protein [Paracoccus onubensis]MDP0928498.1 hypothetical protein [Paracoccus onubensis]